MRSRSLREIQQKGEKAISGIEPLLITTRKGPIGVLMPVTLDSLSFIQREIQKVTALQSLRDSWALAKELKLDRLSDIEINHEVKMVRKILSKKRKSQKQ